jgi:protein-L-isoaspartate(D-aspartate) O-methyltransferase
MDYQKARLAMVESQIRPNGVRDPRILDAFATLPREAFVPDDRKGLAYMDREVLVIPGDADTPARYLLPPMILARMLQAASPSQGDRVLDVGGATGYSAAALSRIGGKVDALESSEPLADATRRGLKAAAIEGVQVHHGALNRGLAAAKPFDVIVVNGGVAEQPTELLLQLAEGGRLVTIIRHGWLGQAWLFSKMSGSVSGRIIFDATAEYLPGFEHNPQFSF